MEVKSLFMNLIMRTYEKQNASSSQKHDVEKSGSVLGADSVTISQRASKRIFRDIMESSLQKGLNEVLIDEN
jgi:hypothetical protein